jgi:hypothetical protein
MGIVQKRVRFRESEYVVHALGYARAASHTLAPAGRPVGGELLRFGADLGVLPSMQAWSSPFLAAGPLEIRK